MYHNTQKCQKNGPNAQYFSEAISTNSKKRPTALLVILTEKSKGAFRFKICALNECKPFIYLLDIN